MRRISLRLCTAFAATIVLGSAQAASCVRLGDESAGEHGPLYAPGSKFAGLVQDGRDGYKADGLNYSVYLNRHTWNGDYFNYSVTRGWGPSLYKFDAAGLPTVIYEASGDYPGGTQYNPATMAQFGLYEHSRWLALHYAPARDAAISAAKWLIDHQEQNGSFAYRFPYTLAGNKNSYRAGWTSALAQGQALSLFARAWSETRDPAYVRAGEKALTFLLTPAAQGGKRFSLAALDPSLANYATFEEYPPGSDNEPGYTMNGMMFVVIGLYDWSFVKSKTAPSARTYFECGAASLKKMVPYAELGGFSAYDLRHVVDGRPPLAAAFYHDIHTMMLFTMFDLTKNLFFERWALKWAGDVDPNLSFYRHYLAAVTAPDRSPPPRYARLP